jgi:hypothetical protein
MTVQAIPLASRPLALRATPEAVLFTAFAALQLWLIFNHAFWFDEAHALLIARAPWSQLAHNLKYEGHPALWYLWLGAVDRLLGGSPWSLPAAQAPISIGILALIWFKAPLPRAAKLLLSLSYWFAFEYGALSRSYGLGALLLLAAVPLRRSIWGWVCLALAANTAAHFALAAGALGAVFFTERWQWKGPLVLAAGAAAAIATVYPVAPDLVPTLGGPEGPWLHRWLETQRAISGALIPSMPSFPYRWQELAPGFFGVAAGLAVLPLGLLALGERWLRLGFLGLYLGLLFLSMTAYMLSVRHTGVLVVFLVAGLWMRSEVGAALPKAAWVWLATATICGLPFLATAEVRPFTYSRALGDWVRAHGLQDERWGAWPGRAGTLLTAETGRPTVNLEKDCANTFVRWDYPHEKVPGPMAHVRRDGVQYVVSEQLLPEGRLLAAFPSGGGWGPAVQLYRFEGPTRSVPPCR